MVTVVAGSWLCVVAHGCAECSKVLAAKTVPSPSTARAIFAAKGIDGQSITYSFVLRRAVGE